MNRVGRVLGIISFLIIISFSFWFSYYTYWPIPFEFMDFEGSAFVVLFVTSIIYGYIFQKEVKEACRNGYVQKIYKSFLKVMIFFQPNKRRVLYFIFGGILLSLFGFVLMLLPIHSHDSVVWISGITFAEISLFYSNAPFSVPQEIVFKALLVFVAKWLFLYVGACIIEWKIWRKV